MRGYVGEIKKEGRGVREGEGEGGVVREEG